MYFIWLFAAAPDIALLYHVVNNVVNVIRIHINEIWFTPNIGANVIGASYVDRSFIHKKLSPRNSNKLGKKKKKANVKGICKSIGRQPPSGFTPTCLYSFICSCCSSIGLSLPTFSLISSSCGFNTRILAIDKYDLRVNGNIAPFNNRVKIRMTIP